MWQELLKSVFELDPLACPCGGRLRLHGLVRGVTLWKALAALGELPHRDGPCAQPRAPPQHLPGPPDDTSDPLFQPGPSDEAYAVDPPSPDC